jgi:signal transduction histidine kinase
MLLPLDATSIAPNRLLVIEDKQPDSMLLEMAIRDSILSTAWIEHAAELTEGVQRLAHDWFDGVILDLGKADGESMSTFTQVLGLGGRAAIVVVTGDEDPWLAEEFFRLGAQDCLVKASIRPGDLGRAVGSAIRRQRVLHELQRSRDEQLQSKDLFLSHISHELRTPLTAIHQFGSLLLDDVGGPLAEVQRDYLTVLMRNVGQLKVMIDDLLEGTRVEGSRATVDCRTLALGALLSEALSAYGPTAQRRGIQIAVLASNLPPVTADPDRLREVLANLLDNAFRFTPDGGSVTVDARPLGDGVCVTVLDTGQGLGPGDEERIFEQFVQGGQPGTKRRDGLGLGLFICRDLIQRQGGTIWATNNPGGGTAVAFTVPAVRTQAAAI